MVTALTISSNFKLSLANAKIYLSSEMVCEYLMPILSANVSYDSKTKDLNSRRWAGSTSQSLTLSSQPVAIATHRLHITHFSIIFFMINSSSLLITICILKVPPRLVDIFVINREGISIVAHPITHFVRTQFGLYFITVGKRRQKAGIVVRCIQSRTGQ